MQFKKCPVCKKFYLNNRWQNFSDYLSMMIEKKYGVKNTLCPRHIKLRDRVRKMVSKKEKKFRKELMKRNPALGYWEQKKLV